MSPLFWQTFHCCKLFWLTSFTVLPNRQRMCVSREREREE